MNTISKIIPVLFLVLAVAYGLYAGELLPFLTGVAGMAFYALSLREEDLPELKGLVAMFSSIFALWKNSLRYLAIVGVALLAVLEFSAIMRRREVKRAIEAQN